jgi:hypothetical protein
MNQIENKINKLKYQIEILEKKQEYFGDEIKRLKFELDELRKNLPISDSSNELANTINNQTNSNEDKSRLEKEITPKPIKTTFPKKQKVKKVINWEKFIGENLISKIGVLFTLIGVIIGSKYAIENELVSPLTRIILGYSLGTALLLTALKLKTKYENYSAIVLSGALAILYFVSFSAYSFYGIINQSIAFGLMVIFTIFTVLSSLHYNKQVIAIIGLVGAYAVPFLLSDGSGRVHILFSYMAIINIGILVLSAKKYWKSLYYLAFGFTWIIYFSWFVQLMNHKEHFELAFAFAGIFFTIFYGTILANTLLRKEKLGKSDLGFQMTNSIIFYCIGIALLTKNHEHLLGLFTLGNGVLHFLVTLWIFRNKENYTKLFHTSIGLVILFISITFPIELDGYNVTILWSIEALVLFWLGRVKSISNYEKLAYPILLVSFISLVHDWGNNYFQSYYSNLFVVKKFLINWDSLGNILFAVSMGILSYIITYQSKESSLTKWKFIPKLFNYLIPIFFFFGVFMMFYLEINNYFKTEIYLSKIGNSIDFSIVNTRKVVISLWVLFYMSILALVNTFLIKKNTLGKTIIGLGVFACFLFLTRGLYSLSELREIYLDTSNQEFPVTKWNLGIRYLALFVFGGFITSNVFHVKKFTLVSKNLSFLFLHLAIVWVLSSELLHWMDIFSNKAGYKLALSILWAVYSLLLIVLGIWKKNKLIRFGAIALFGATVVKLFFYDLTHLSTISKTIVFVALGIILLIISFLYNKYKHIISDEKEN